LLNIVTKSSTINMNISSSLFMLHAVQSINFTSSLLKLRTYRMG
jgi:hypothetical protein